jgi:FtsP/CotA-like multicopper oxidase with cupredoxin domain
VPLPSRLLNTSSPCLGQRYEVVINANQTVGNYWLRVMTGGGQCDGPNTKTLANDTKAAIFRYDGASTDDPTSTASPMGIGCQEETTIVPYVNFAIPNLGPYAQPVMLDLALDTTNGVFWKVNGQALDINWVTPTLQYVFDGTYINQIPSSYNSMAINGDGFIYFLIQNDTPLSHSFHLHGHDIYIVSTGAGSYSKTQGPSTFYNLTRRDTHSVEAGGYLVFAMAGGNPGAWLLHCQISLHISRGLGIQILDNPSLIVETIGNSGNFTDDCESWRDWTTSGTNKNFSQGDSGLRR